MTNRIQFEGGDILANLETRTITGLLLPFNEEGRTNLGLMQVEAGAVTVPTDPMVVGLNTDHDRPATVGRAVRLETKADGIYATFEFAKTAEGDAALADALNPNGKRRKLSAEFGPAMIKAGKLVAGHARLWGAALVEAGAFPSAQVLAADTPDAPPAEDAPADTTPAEPTETTEEFSDSFTDEAGKTYKRKTTRTTRTEPDGDGGTKTTITEKTVLEEPDAPAPVTEQEPTVAVPNTLATAATMSTKAETIDYGSIFAAFHAFKESKSPDAAAVLATLTDIKVTGSGALPGTGVLRENWMGKLWQGRSYQRKFVTLGNLGNAITLAGKKGFTIGRGTASSPAATLGGDWAGNKAEVPTGQGFTATKSSTRANWAFGADVAREFFDLPGGEEIVASFFQLLVEDYAIWSDGKALAAWVTAGGTAVAPDTYPTDYPAAMGMLLQSIIAVEDANDSASFSIVNKTAFKQLIYTPKDLVPEYINFVFGTDGKGFVDGKVNVVSAPDAAFTGLEPDEPAVLSGSRNAIDFDELGETPLVVDALEIAKGGVDRATHGYLQTFVVRPESVNIVGTIATP